MGTIIGIIMGTIIGIIMGTNRHNVHRRSAWHRRACSVACGVRRRPRKVEPLARERGCHADDGVGCEEQGWRRSSRPLTAHSRPLTVHSRPLTVHIMPLTVHIRPIIVHILPISAHY